MARPRTEKDRARDRARDARRRKDPKRRAYLAEAHRRHRAAHPEKVRARDAMKHALESGKIGRLPCEVCGTIENLQGHHDDYTKPLEVRWFCRVHHAELHRPSPTSPP